LNSHVEQHETIRQYLLGQLSEPEGLPLEQRLLDDGVFYEELLIAEDELIDQYLKGELSQPEQASFAAHFLQAPERQEKFRFSRALKKYVAENASEQESIGRDEGPAPARWTPEPRKPRFFFLPFRNPVTAASFAFVVLLIVLGSWLVLRYRRESPTPQSLFAVELSAGQTRGTDEQLKVFAIPPGKDAVRFQLLLSGNHYQSYKAELRDTEGQVLFAGANLKPQSLAGRSLIVWEIPAGKIRVGSNVIKLSEIDANGNSESAGSYSFRVLGNP
jgi:hypothetical protein